MTDLDTLRAEEALHCDFIRDAVAVGIATPRHLITLLSDYAAAIEARVNFTHAMLAANQEQMRRDIGDF